MGCSCNLYVHHFVYTMVSRIAGRISILFQPFILLIILLSGSNKILELNGIFIPYVQSYMDDILCMPFVLSIALFVMRKFVFKDTHYFLGKWQILAAIIYCSVLFELILPQFSARYTSDAWDVVCYISGGIAFNAFNNRKQLMPGYSA